MGTSRTRVVVWEAALLALLLTAPMAMAQQQTPELSAIQSALSKVENSSGAGRADALSELNYHISSIESLLTENGYQGSPSEVVTLLNAIRPQIQNSLKDSNSTVRARAAETAASIAMRLGHYSNQTKKDAPDVSTQAREGLAAIAQSMATLGEDSDPEVRRWAVHVHAIHIIATQNIRNDRRHIIPDVWKPGI